LQDRAFERVGGRTTVEADVRIVCATHRDLEEQVSAGKFREDLYYRLRVVEIELPSLAARGPDEVEALARHFADMYATKYDRPKPKFETDALQKLRAHNWPGNVRELEHWIESAVVLAPRGVISASVLPTPRSKKKSSGEMISVPAGVSLDDASRAYAEAVVQACNGNKALAAKKLGVGRNTLARLLKRGEIE
jgi:DNA-binding NtrC family response regulator